MSQGRISFGGSPLDTLERTTGIQDGGAPTVEIRANGRSDHRISVMKKERSEQVRRLKGGVRPSGSRVIFLTSIAARFLVTFLLFELFFVFDFFHVSFSFYFCSVSLICFCFCFCFCFVQFFIEKKSFTFGQVKGNARHGRSRHQPKYSSLQS